MSIELTLARAKAAQANKGKNGKVFDWDEAARILIEQNAVQAEAGLAEDWNATSDLILDKGRPELNSGTYLGSNWATPILKINDRIFECWKLESEAPQWDPETLWPESALDIFNKSKPTIEVAAVVPPKLLGE